MKADANEIPKDCWIIIDRPDLCIIIVDQILLRLYACITKEIVYFVLVFMVSESHKSSFSVIIPLLFFFHSPLMRYLPSKSYFCSSFHSLNLIALQCLEWAPCFCLIFQYFAQTDFLSGISLVNVEGSFLIGLRCLAILRIYLVNRWMPGRKTNGRANKRNIRLIDELWGQINPLNSYSFPCTICELWG